MYWEGFFSLGFFQVNSCVTDIEITLHTMSDVVIRLIILRVLALVKGFITSTDFLLLERQISWVITFITEEIYLFDTIIPQFDHMLVSPWARAPPLEPWFVFLWILFHEIELAKKKKACFTLKNQNLYWKGFWLQPLS